MIHEMMKQENHTNSLTHSETNNVPEALRICLENGMFKWRGHFGDAIDNGPLFEPGKLRILLA